MKTDTLLNLYQSYTLTKVNELNKQSLVAIYAQNEQLSKLNQELAEANRTTKQILKNQIKEIELQEKCRYFKNMTFNLSQAMTLLENEENVNFRIFACGLFLSPIRDIAKNAIPELEEIVDKEYAQKIIQRANALSDKNENSIESYKESSWAFLLPAKTKIEDIAKKNKDKKKSIRQITTKREEAYKHKIKKAEKDIKATEGCFGCLVGIVTLLILVVAGTIYTHDYDAMKGAFILLIPAVLLLAGGYVEKKSKNKIGLNNEKVKTEETEEEILEKEFKVLSDELTNLEQEETKLNTQYNELLQDVTADCPKWENKLNEIATYIPHEEKNDHIDPLLTDAAKLIVKTKDASVSLIQRKFVVGYNRAGRIMNQLENLGIVGPANGMKPRELLCKSEEELSELLNLEE